MSSLDPASKDIAFSNFIQVIRSRTARGFVPNFSAGGTKSVDRTEPPIGAKVLLEMHKRYGDEQSTWLVKLLFDDLLVWNDWMASSRTLGPLGIVSLGSDTISGFKDFDAGDMQGARYESGLDNSPMYDGTYFTKNLSRIGRCVYRRSYSTPPSPHPLSLPLSPPKQPHNESDGSLRCRFRVNVCDGGGGVSNTRSDRRSRPGGS